MPENIAEIDEAIAKARAAIKKVAGPERYTMLEERAEHLADLRPGATDIDAQWVLIELRDVNQLRCEPPLDDHDVVAIVQRYKPSLRDYYEHAPSGIIVTDRHLREVTAEALQAMYQLNYPPLIFRHHACLARLAMDEQKRPYIETLNLDAFRGLLARCCDFLRSNNKDYKPIPPPMDVVRDCLSLGDWGFPPLLGITETPVMRPDGTILTAAGYDADTQLYYRPDPGLSVPPIPDNPTDSDVQTAYGVIWDIIADFPFDDEASAANAIAALLSPLVRPMIPGPVPLVVFTKPQQGTGASLLAEVISIIATGRPGAMMSAQSNDDEWKKTIVSLLLKGQLVITIDNVDSALWAPSLATVLTATTYEQRILGRSEMVQLPNRATWIATGNNVKLRGDLPRRCYFSKLDAKTARPWLRDRKSFGHPQLREYVTDNRGAILAAALTIARAWAVAGRPCPDDLPTLGNYESWCDVVGGILTFMGVKGFLGNLNAMYDEADSETPQWEAFLEAWMEYIGRQAVTTGEVIEFINTKADLKSALPDSLMSKDGRDYNRRLGHALARQCGVRFSNGLRIIRGAKRKHKVMTWQVAGEIEGG